MVTTAGSAVSRIANGEGGGRGALASEGGSTYPHRCRRVPGRRPQARLAYDRGYEPPELRRFSAALHARSGRRTPLAAHPARPRGTGPEGRRPELLEHG